MLTVLDAIKLSTEYLEKKGVGEARINAELLLAEILNCKRLELYLAFDRPLTEVETKLYRSHISRRGKFEPLQYITGNVEFMGLKFFVSKDVLIPRPETEILVEKIIDFYHGKENLSILDIGTGSGNIAVSLAKNLLNSKILAVDLSDKAVNLAQKNASFNETESQIEFQIADVFDLHLNNQFDVIVSNPPYVDEEQYNSLQKEIVAFEPKMALTDFSDGFNFYKKITDLSKSLLKENGRIFYEIGIGQAKKVEQILEENNIKNIVTLKDYAGIERVVYGEKV